MRSATNQSRPSNIVEQAASPVAPDHYAILEISPKATVQEINQAWRRLVLLHHPDRQAGTAISANGGIDIRLVNEARWVLCDPVKRAEWEESRSSEFMYRLLVSVEADESATRPDRVYTVAKPKQPHVTNWISLSDFTPHYSQDERNEDEAEASYYTHPCRCSSEFLVTRQDLEDGIEVVGCGGCGEWIGVGYEVIDGDA